MHHQLSADRELQMLLLADRDSGREAVSCIQRESDRDMQKQIQRQRHIELVAESQRDT